MTGSPAGRVLALLERVQEHPGLTAPRLADELGVSERTVRRYVTTLQELGIPVEAGRGRYGGHRLRPGYRMPPLMLSTDEAVAITLALALSDGAPGDDAPATTALTKLRHVLPRGVSDRVHAVLDAVVPPTADTRRPGADPGSVAALAAGVVERRRCRVRHRSTDGTSTVRELNPYGLAVVFGSLYVHGWCHLRQARRTFRVDRIDRVDLLGRTFRMPAGFDVAEAVERSLALARPEWSVSLLMEAPLADVEPWIPRFLGVCEAVDAATTRVRSSTSNPDYFVLRISDHPFAMTVEEPDAVREAFARAAERFAHAARLPAPDAERVASA
ncbi:MAG TPA: YafY family protein [Nocardioides sp.]|uniref:helix-turn-helix transcriptional regulator n=1 Tax=Nocardioides sp. TaxID=35761 RepID=UPI002F40CAE1